MNHPKHEDWIPYLYGEADTDLRRRLKAHFASCAECRGQFEAWQISLRRLDAWKLPRVKSPVTLLRANFKWAAAAALVLGFGFIAGHWSEPKPDLQAIRAALEPQLRSELKTELAQVVRTEVSRAAATTLAQAEQQTTNAISAFGETLEARRNQDQKTVHAALLVLKEQLDTVAMNTDAGLRQAERKLVQLADYKQPQNPPPQP